MVTHQREPAADPAEPPFAPPPDPALSSDWSSGSQPPGPGKGKSYRHLRCWSRQSQSQVGSRACLCWCHYWLDQSSWCHLPASSPDRAPHLGWHPTLVTTLLAELGLGRALGSSVRSGRWREKGWRLDHGGVGGLHFDCLDPNETIWPWLVWQTEDLSASGAQQQGFPLGLALRQTPW